MWKFIAAGDGDNAAAFALGAHARDLTDEEYSAADAAGLLGDEARALFEHVQDSGGPHDGDAGSGSTPAGSVLAAGSEAAPPPATPRPRPGRKEGD